MALFLNGLENVGLLVLRVVLGAIFIYHSIPKLKAPSLMAKGIGKSKSFVSLLGITEFVAGLFLILGFLTRVGALLIVIVMLGALYYKLVKWKVPFSSMDKLGWEFDIILLAAAVALIFLGDGAISIDAFIPWA